MAARLLRHYDFLRSVMRAKKSALTEATTKEIGILVEIVVNIIHTDKVGFYDEELVILRPIRPLLTTLSLCNDARVARKLLYKLSREQLKTIIRASFDVTGLRHARGTDPDDSIEEKTQEKPVRDEKEKKKESDEKTVQGDEEKKKSDEKTEQDKKDDEKDKGSKEEPTKEVEKEDGPPKRRGRGGVPIEYRLYCKKWNL